MWKSTMVSRSENDLHMLQTYLWPCASDEHHLPNRVLRFHANANVMGDKLSRAIT